MKRGIFLVLALLSFLINNVTAQQEIETGGIPLIAFFPLLLLILALAGFIYFYIRDHMDVIKSFLYKRKKKIGLKKETDYVKEIEEFEKRLDTLEPEEGLQTLSGLIREFFADKFEIKYKFTSHELEKELKKGRKEWAKIAKELSDIKFSGEDISKDHLKKIAEKLKKIAKKKAFTKLELKPSEKIKQKRLKKEINYLDILKDYILKFSVKKRKKKKEKPHRIITELKKEKGKKLEGIKGLLKTREFKIGEGYKEDIISKAEGLVGSELTLLRNVKEYLLGRVSKTKEAIIFDYLGDGRRHLTKKDIEEAKKVYSKILNLYYKLPVEAQKELSTDMLKYYNEIEDAVKQKEKEEINKIVYNIEELKKKSLILSDERKTFLENLNNLTGYAKKIREQGLFGLKLGLDNMHLKVKGVLKDIKVDQKKPIKEETKKVIEDLAKITSKEEFDVPVLRDERPKIKRFIEDTQDYINRKKERFAEFIHQKAPKIEFPKGLEAQGPVEETLAYTQKKLKEKKLKIRERILFVNFRELLNKIKEREEKGLKPIKKEEHAIVKRFHDFIQKEKKALEDTKTKIGEFIEGILKHIRREKRLELKRLKRKERAIVQDFYNFLNKVKEREKKGMELIKKEEQTTISKFLELSQKEGEILGDTKEKVSEFIEKALTGVKEKEHEFADDIIKKEKEEVAKIAINLEELKKKSIAPLEKKIPKPEFDVPVLKDARPVIKKVLEDTEDYIKEKEEAFARAVHFRPPKVKRPKPEVSRYTQGAIKESLDYIKKKLETDQLRISERTSFVNFRELLNKIKEREEKGLELIKKEEEAIVKKFREILEKEERVFVDRKAKIIGFIETALIPRKKEEGIVDGVAVSVIEEAKEEELPRVLSPVEETLAYIKKKLEIGWLMESERRVLLNFRELLNKIKEREEKGLALIKEEEHAIIKSFHDLILKEERIFGEKKAKIIGFIESTLAKARQEEEVVSTFEKEVRAKEKEIIPTVDKEEVLKEPEEDKARFIAPIDDALKRVKQKEQEGLYKLNEKGRDLLIKVEDILNKIKEKGIVDISLNESMLLDKLIEITGSHTIISENEKEKDMHLLNTLRANVMLYEEVKEEELTEKEKELIEEEKELKHMLAEDIVEKEEAVEEEPETKPVVKKVKEKEEEKSAPSEKEIALTKEEEDLMHKLEDIEKG